MAKQALGTIRIDFKANLAEAFKGIDRFTGKLDGMLFRTAATLKKQEKEFTKTGLKLSAQLTLPLTAFAAAAVKAADPQGKFVESLERMALQAGKALEPVGRVLIRVFEEARPFLELGIKLINKLGEEFEALDPKTQDMIVAAGLLVAALGPVFLALGVMTNGLRLVVLPMAYVVSWLAKLTGGLLGFAAAIAKTGFQILIKGFELVGTAAAGTVPALTALGGALLALAAIFVGFRIGTWLYDNFKIVQQVAAMVIREVDLAWEALKTGARLAFNAVRGAAVDMLHAVLDPLATKINDIATALYQLGTITPKQFIKANEVARSLKFGFGAFDAKAERDRIVAEWKKTSDDIENVYMTTLATIEREFGDKSSKGRGFVEGVFGLDQGAMAEFIAKTKATLAGAGEAVATGWEYAQHPMESVATLMGMLIEKAQGLTAGMRVPFVQTKKEAGEAAKALQEFEALVEKLRSEAEQVRFEIFPGDKLQEELDRLKAVQGITEDPRTLEAIRQKMQQTRVELAALSSGVVRFRVEAGDAIKGWAGEVANKFADLVVDGKANFKELLVSWEKTLIAMLVKATILQPIFDAIAGGVRGYFRPGESPGGYGDYTAPAGPVTANQGGLIGRDGRVLRFAGGGVVPGGGTNRDSVPALLSPGEFVLRRSAVGRVGAGALQALNNGGGGGGVVVNVIDQRTGGERAQVSKRRGPDGGTQIEVLIRDAVKGMFGRGDFDKTMSSTFGVRRVAAAG